MSSNRISRALISVSDKTGLVEFATQLTQLNIDILSTGGTANILRNHNIPVTDVSEYTEFPEIMGGRVKTLHPKIHGALLGRVEQDSELMTKHDITPIDLVVVNLYPFEETITAPECKLEHAIEQIDIGGPTMLRAAAKNYRRVTVVTDQTDYGRILQEIKDNGGNTSEQTRFEMASKAFALTANFDASISKFLSQNMHQDTTQHFPEHLTIQYKKKMDLRYGENPHQHAAFYKEKQLQESSITTAHLLQGKPLSFNNIADADAALECVRNFTDTNACVIVKHANPCGVALHESQLDAYLNAFACDSSSAFGGIIAFNQPLEPKTAQTIINNQFVELIIAPEIDQKVRDILVQKPNVRALACGNIADPQQLAFDYKRVNGGLLVQNRDIKLFNEQDLRVVTKIKPTKEQMQDLEFAWIIAKYVKSNAIVFAKDKRTLGIGAGQMSRIDSTKIAARKASEAGFSLPGAVMASDAFFPFKDAIERAADCGISAIIQPGGSIRDDEVVNAADEAGIAMVFTSMRHFKH